MSGSRNAGALGWRNSKWVPAVLFVITSAYWCSEIFGQTDSVGTHPPSTVRDNSDAIQEGTLPPLPEVPRLDAVQPNAEDIQDLSAKLDALFSEERDIGESAIGELLEIHPRTVAAIHQRLVQLADRSDKERMKRILSDARRRMRSVLRSSTAAVESGTRQTESDVLLTLLRSEKPRDSAWRDCVTLEAMIRMLAAPGTVDGARELIVAYARFGEFVRVEVQQRLSDMKDRSVAALVEARRHPAEKIARWAALRLDQLGKAIPGETARTDDYDALADILRAYGRIRDPDAARIIVSFANSERIQLRLAARQAIAMLGPVGMWQLRDAYEDVVGRRPRRDWTWDRTARELFGEFDRLRLARVFGTFTEGMRSLQTGDLEAMGRAFDVVLTKDPLFERRSQMAPGYFRLAQQLADRNPEAALQALIRVERLAPEPKLANSARSLDMTLRVAQNARRGVVDIDQLGRAAELDPQNSRAVDLLAKAQFGASRAQTVAIRWVSSAVIAGFGLVAVLFVLLRRAKNHPSATTLASPHEGSISEKSGL